MQMETGTHHYTAPVDNNALYHTQLSYYTESELAGHLVRGVKNRVYIIFSTLLTTIVFLLLIALIWERHTHYDMAGINFLLAIVLVNEILIITVLLGVYLNMNKEGSSVYKMMMVVAVAAFLGSMLSVMVYYEWRNIKRIIGY